MKKLSLREIQLEELEILDKSVEIFKKNRIKYYLWSGTLIGAVRHKGFIPWDDDIDLFMPRPDFEKVLDLVRKNPDLFGKNLICTYSELDNSLYPYIKICNKNITIKNDFGADNNLWIDIFPIDGLPKSNITLWYNYLRIIYLRKILCNLLMKEEFIKNHDSKIVAIIRHFIKLCYKGKEKKIVTKIVKISKKYDYDAAKRVGGQAWNDVHRQILTKDQLKVRKFNFEGKKYDGIAAYDYLLTGLYGDYMKLPPKEKQVNHEMEVYKIK